MLKSRSRLSIIYKGVVGSIDKVVPQPMQPIWQSAAGPRTIFFWAPIFKWGLVFAGLGDIKNRPPNTISICQSSVIVVSGLINTRWSFVIKPKNYNFFGVNLVLILTQTVLLYRAIKWDLAQQEYTQCTWLFRDQTTFSKRFVPA